MALSVKQLQDKKARLAITLEIANKKVRQTESDIAEVQVALEGKTAELQAQIDAINSGVAPVVVEENKTEEVI